MTKSIILAFERRMVEAAAAGRWLSSYALGREVGIRQQVYLSRWLQEAYSLPTVASNTRKARVWSVRRKLRVLAAASKLSGGQLDSYPRARRHRSQRISSAGGSPWRRTVGIPSADVESALRKLEQRGSLAKRKPSAEAAVLLVLKRSTATTRKRTTTPTSRARSHTSKRWTQRRGQQHTCAQAAKQASHLGPKSIERRGATIRKARMLRHGHRWPVRTTPSRPPRRRR